MNSNSPKDIIELSKPQKLLLIMVHLIKLPVPILGQQYEKIVKELKAPSPLSFMETLKELLPYVNREKRERSSFLEIASTNYKKEMEFIFHVFPQ